MVRVWSVIVFLFFLSLFSNTVVAVNDSEVYGLLIESFDPVENRAEAGMVVDRFMEAQNITERSEALNLVWMSLQGKGTSEVAGGGASAKASVWRPWYNRWENRIEAVTFGFVKIELDWIHNTVTGFMNWLRGDEW